MRPYGFAELRARHDLWGRHFESAAGAHLIPECRRQGVQLRYWNAGNKEVDFVLRKGERLAALEVKSEDADSVSGMREFKSKHQQAKPYLIGGQGLSLERFFSYRADRFIGQS